jgi:YesN/AraC family two-component response regulator
MNINEDTLATTIEKIIEKTPTKELKVLSVKKISNTVNKNENIIRKIYKKKRDFNLSKLIFYKKIQKAIILMERNNDLSIKEISKIIGYEKTEYFCLIIKKIFGKTPSEIKNKYKKKQVG